MGVIAEHTENILSPTHVRRETGGRRRKFLAY